MKRVFGTIEAIFDISYLLSALLLALFLLFTDQGDGSRFLAGIMALVLAGGDSFHLFPRIALIKTGKEEELRKALGIGKQVTSITMTIFYLLLWQIGLIIFSPKDISFWSNLLYILAAIRIFICLLPQNDWQARYSPQKWAILRNLAFLFQGLLVASLFFIQRTSHYGLNLMWLAIFLSFTFYLPVVFWANKNPKLGMLMLPKTSTYLWMIGMCLTL